MTNPLPPTDSPAGIADDQIEELLRLEAEATRISTQEWVTKDRGFGKRPRIGIYSSAPSDMVNVSYLWDGRHESQAPKVADFIVAMRNAIKPLIARLKRAEAERDILRTRVVAQEAAWLERLMQSLEKESVKSIVEERDRLKEALEPFAEAAKLVMDERSACWPSAYQVVPSDDLRRAAAVLADAGKGGGE